jgi:hypothetical protein
MRLLLAALALLAAFTSSAQAGIVFSDHFTSPSLDSAWTTTFSNATGWNYSVPSASGTDLVVTDIFGVPPQLSGGNYGIVSLARSFGPITDFQLQFDFAWDSGDTLRAMQYVEVSLYDANSILIVSSGYRDAWVASRGSTGATIGGTVLPFVADTMPLAGSASVSIERYGSAASVSWNGQQILSGSTATPVVSARLSFGFFNYPGEGPFNPSSTFGSESVDLIRLSSPDVDAAVPEPASLAIWAVGVFGLIGALRFKRSASTSVLAFFALIAAAHPCHAAIDAGARVILGSGSPWQQQFGEYGASAAATDSYEVYFGQHLTVTGTADVLGTSTNGFLKAKVDALDPYFAPFGFDGPGKGLADAAWQDIVHHTGDLAQIRVTAEVSFVVTLKDFFGAASGTGNLLFRMQEIGAPITNLNSFPSEPYNAGYFIVGPQWGALTASATKSWFDGTVNYYHNSNPTTWDSVTAFTSPEAVEFVARKSIILNYNASIDGYAYLGNLRVGAHAQGMRVIADGGNSASIVDITDLQGNSIRDQVTFQSGMTFPQAAAVPEPASLAIWGLVGTSLAFDAVRRRRNRP